MAETANGFDQRGRSVIGDYGCVRRNPAIDPAGLRDGNQPAFRTMLPNHVGKLMDSVVGQRIRKHGNIKTAASDCLHCLFLRPGRQNWYSVPAQYLGPVERNFPNSTKQEHSIAGVCGAILFRFGITVFPRNAF
jgi:hypothetical protein